MNPSIIGIGTAVPKHTIAPEEARAFAAHSFAGKTSGLERMLKVFEHEALCKRHLAEPVEWYRTPKTIGQRNEAYRRNALPLLGEACRAALADADVQPSQVAAIVCVSSTGISTPSLEATLAQDLGLARDVARLPLWGLGCGGGGAAIARARALALGLNAPVLVACVELCSLTFVPSDHSSANVVATSLFADGAASVLVVPPGYAESKKQQRRLELLASHAELYPNSEDLMGWDFADDGFRVRFAKTIPAFVRRHSGAFVRDCCARVDLTPEQLAHFVLHPGGPRVLSGYAESLGLATERLEPAWQVMADYGNMSSPTVIFVLERFVAERKPTGSPGLLMAVGPGFSAEGCIFRY